VFGPTYPGHFEESTCTYYLSYPGITFVFPIPSIYANLFSKQKKEDNSSNNKKNNDEYMIPMEFPNGTTPIATNVYVYNGHDFRSPNLPQDFDHDSYASAIARHLDVIIGKGIIVYNDFDSNEGKQVHFNDTTQDVLMSLGAPNNIYYKRHDKLRIHYSATKKLSNGDTSNNTNDSLKLHKAEYVSRELTAVDYFYNYYTLGFDIMFNGQTHTVQKIILHTNFPGSKDFNIYVKCNFRIRANQFSQATGDSIITGDTKFSEIQNILQDELSSKPLVNDATTASNPFGGTRFYAYSNCIFEIMKNGHINAVILFM
jgi:hypothetical protein